MKSTQAWPTRLLTTWQAEAAPPAGLAALKVDVPPPTLPDGTLPLIRVLKQGMLTKLSKGGFTANWNRRAFCLIGSSLFYAKDRATLNVHVSEASSRATAASASPV